MHDVLIIGAGAAGLACGQTLLRSGLRVAILEASGRVGGRIFTRHCGPGRTPVELGAEFVHGGPKEILGPLDSVPLAFVDVTDRHTFGPKHEIALWDQVNSIFAKLRRGRGDQNVAAALTGVRADPLAKALFRSYVEGFHAADLSQLGVKGLLRAEESGDSDLNGASLFRLTAGYSDFLDKIFLADPRLTQAIQFHSPVTEVEWSKRGVRLHHGLAATMEGSYVVVTAPLGVLQAGSIRWNPGLPFLDDILAHLHVGHVARIVFQFRSRFWEGGSGGHAPAFFHAGPESYFPTWWTLAPQRSPLLVAWQGGPNAREVLAHPEEVRVSRALESLSRILRIPTAAIRRELVSYFHHDWSHDPLSLGAYSYLGVHGSTAARRLGEPLAERIFLAGEASADGPSRGTVHGAIRSGQRAARKILRLMAPGSRRAA